MEARVWNRNHDMWERFLEKDTGVGVKPWLERIEEAGLADERGLRSWLARQGVTGYAQALLVMERYGDPRFVSANAADLVDRQYADRPRLRLIYDAIIAAAERLGEASIRARRTYVSLVSPRRTFARIQATTKTRVDLGLRLDGRERGRRLRPSRIHATMGLQIELRAPEEVDADAVEWLSRAYRENS